MRSSLALLRLVELGLLLLGGRERIRQQHGCEIRCVVSELADGPGVLEEQYRPPVDIGDRLNAEEVAGGFHRLPSALLHPARRIREVLLHRRGDDAESAELEQRQIAIDAERRGLVYMT